MARQDKNRVTVSGTVSPALGDFLEDYRWKNRKNRSAVVGDALLAWAQGEGFSEPETGETPAESAESADSSDAAESEPQPEPVGAKPSGRRAR